jgi:hypothetical protein
VATSPVPSWAREQSPTYRGPTVAGVFFRLALILAVLWALGAMGPAMAESERKGREAPTLCDEHAGRPGWAEVCARHR